MILRSEENGKEPQSDNSAQVGDGEGGGMDPEADVQGAAGPPQQEELPRPGQGLRHGRVNRYHYQSSLSSFVIICHHLSLAKMAGVAAFFLIELKSFIIIYHHFRSGKKKGRTGSLSPESGIY